MVIVLVDCCFVDLFFVVELCVYEGYIWEVVQDKDIIFLYNVNFFFYVIFEYVRVMVYGCVQILVVNMLFVLIGMFVFGMVYLDCFIEVGYFLFFDLFVRYEGCYRLMFSFYEEIKEDKDKDLQSDSFVFEGQSFSLVQGGFFDFRMEVKLQDFVVYSVKKFFGLVESIVFSCMVVE